MIILIIGNYTFLQAENQASKNEINHIETLVLKAKNRIKKENNNACLMEKGMTKEEVIKALGQPSGVDSPLWQGNLYKSRRINTSYCTELYYGEINLTFGNNNILKYIKGCKEYKARIQKLWDELNYSKK